ncbi:MAG: flagellar hook protein FlgE [Capsulimonas sp.]|uniref:flagellar hook protein FlgE n=1 Tax=Capsulimonas sp. TaxID=2494211 RepID=UPI003264D288
MLQAMYSGVSAIQAHQTKMEVIGNNIANVSTTGYKAGRVTFKDQLSQTLQGASAGSAASGGTNPVQLGLGVAIGSVDTISSQGGLQSTSKPTDLAIQGNGYFMLGDSSGVSFTRDGSFTVDNSGNLVNSSTGAFVLGWQADPTGAIDTTKQLTQSSNLSIPVGGLITTSPTKNVIYSGNLSAEAKPTDAAYTRTVKVYDSLGEAQNITLSFKRDAPPVAPATLPNGTTSSWTWTASGTGVAGTGKVFYGSTGKEALSTGTIALSPTDGSTSPQGIKPDFSATTQVSGGSGVIPDSQDGFGPGTLQSYSIDQTGAIAGIFSNGMSRSLGQIAMAGFSNPEGLERAGGNAFKESVNSGSAHIGTATQDGLGKMSSGYLEQSNVDLSSEFTSMIVTQRGFQANTKIVTTVDEMLNDVIGMKR